MELVAVQFQGQFVGKLDGHEGAVVASVRSFDAEVVDQLESSKVLQIVPSRSTKSGAPMRSAFRFQPSIDVVALPGRR